MVPPNNLGPDIQFSIVLCARYQSNPKISHLIAMKRILSYNNGNYVDHPTPETVKKELGKIAINPSYLDKTPVLKNSFPAAWRILFTFVIQGPEASGALSKKSKRPKSKKSPIETMVTLPKPTEGSEQSHSWGQRLRGNKPPANMKPQNPTYVDLSGTGAKYQEDQTQSSRLRYQSLTRNEGEPLKVRKTFWELVKRWMTILSLLKPNISLLLLLRKTNPLHLLLHTLKHPTLILQSQTDKLVEASMCSFEKGSTTINDLYKGLEIITQLLKDITNSVKDDPATNKKIKEAPETLAKIFT
nr:hypothetical protein [Tanacetum cinerariifolium]